MQQLYIAFLFVFPLITKDDRCYGLRVSTSLLRYSSGIWYYRYDMFISSGVIFARVRLVRAQRGPGSRFRRRITVCEVYPKSNTIV